MLGLHDDLATAEESGLGLGDKVVASALELVSEMIQAAFDRDGKVFVHMPTGRIQGLLRRAVVVQNGIQYLDLALWLVMSAHHPKGHERMAVPRSKGRDDRVIRPLAACDLVGVSGLSHETFSPILHRDAGMGNDHAGAEIIVMRLNH